MGEERVKGLASMVDYQKGSVVSRTVIDKDTGSVTIFAFDSGEGLSEHTAPYEALVQVLEGTAGVKIAGESYNVEAGEIIIMPADVPHALQAPERFKMMLVMIKD